MTENIDNLVIAVVPVKHLNDIGIESGEFYSASSHEVIHKHDLERYKKMEKLLKELTDKVNKELSCRS